MKKFFLVLSFISSMFISLTTAQTTETASPIASRNYTYLDLVDQLTNLESLATLPVPGEKCRQWSSYDRASQFDPKTGKYLNWSANGDGGGFIRKEGKLQVMAEMKGPGVIWRIWSARPDSGRVKIFLDGNSEPVVDLPFIKYFDRTVSPFTYPALVHEAAKGLNNYTPIPFQKSCRILAEKNWGNYYHFTYTIYPQGTTLPTFTMNLSEPELKALENSNRKLTTEIGIDPAGPRQGQITELKSVSVEPGKTGEVIQINGAFAICALKVQIPNLPSAPADQEILSGLALSIKWDEENQASVWSPLGDFFGTAPGVNLYKSLPMGMTNNEFYSYWYMPFEKGALVELANETGNTQTANFTIELIPLAPANAALLARFHAKWHLDAFLPVETERLEIDWTLLKTEGNGRFCGVALHVWNPQGGWWGEGDEKFFVDGEKFPSTFGTGSEDYFGYAWSNPALFEHAFHNQTISQNNMGHISVNRWQIADNVPFTKSFEASIEKYYPNNKPTRYASTVYWYQAAGGKDLYQPVEALERSEYCLEPGPLPEDGVLDGIFVDQMDLILICPFKDAEIRYTRDGSEPTATSVLYDQPIKIDKTCTVAAKSFRSKAGILRPLSETVFIKRTGTEYQPAVNPDNPVNGIEFAYYKGTWDVLPNFRKLKPVSVGRCDNFLMQPHPENFFAFRFTGFIKIPTTGVYTFFTTSDDGSQLYINDRLVINNDGLHAPEEKMTQVALQAGFHSIQVTMFEKDGGEELLVHYAGPGIKKSPIPKEMLFMAGRSH